MGILKTAKDILTGWGNLTLNQFDLLDPWIKEQAELRLNHCDTCEMRTENKCNPNKVGIAVQDFTYNNQQRFKGQEYTGCGCNIYAKCCAPDVDCPLGKWLKMKLNGSESQFKDTN